MRHPFVLLMLALTLSSWTFAASEVAPQATGPLDFVVQDIRGREVNLRDYQGKVVLIVNVASRCGFTKQYAALEALYRKYQEQGLTILAFPCNDFGAQEPGSAEEIVQFCKRNYEVSFPLFAKIKVKGEGQAPLYALLTSPQTNPKYAGEIKWNFTKFLVGRDGRLASRFASAVKPDSEEMIKAIEAELARPTTRPAQAAGVPRPGEEAAARR